MKKLMLVLALVGCTQNQVPKLPDPESVEKAVAVYRCLLDVHNSTLKSINELCPDIQNRPMCLALPELLATLKIKVDECKRVQ